MSFLPDFDEEHIGIVLAKMATSFPKIDIEHIGSDDLFVASDEILLLDNIDEVIIYDRACRIEEGTAWGQLIKEEQFLLFADDSMVVLSQLFLNPVVFLHLSLLHEADSVHSLKTVILGIGHPIRAAVLQNLYGLYFRTIYDMGSGAQIYQRATPVGRRFGIIPDFASDQLLFKGIVFEHI